MHKTFSLQKYFRIEACSTERIPFHVTPSSVLTLNVMETCMHVLKYYKKQNTLKNEAILMYVYLRSPTFLPGFPRTPWSPFSPRHLQITLQHFLSATVSWKITRNILFTYINHKTKTDSPPFFLYHRRTYKVSLQEVCNICKPNTQRFVVSKPSAKLYFPKFSQVLCIVQAN